MPFRKFLHVIVFAGALFPTGIGAAAELTVESKEMPRVPPTQPAAALKTFSVKPGFHLELAAHEPLVVDPVTMCFDEQGRLFVVEMIDYSERRDEDPHLGRVRMLTDDDGDGRFDRATVYADKLPWPTAVVCYDGGVFVGATPDIVWCRDNDGDGRADERKVVFTGFGAKASRLNVQALFNSFQWGMDNRIHGTCATIGGNEVVRPDRPELPPVKLNRVDFSFDPRKLDLRPEAGGGQYGMSFDSEGRKFMCSNSDHAQMAMYAPGDVGANPLFAMPSHRVSIAADGKAAEVFRLSPDEPWRVIRTRWRISGVVRGVVEGGGRVSGYFTGATGLTVYQGDAYGEGFGDNLFVGDAGGNLVHRKQVDHTTLPPVARRPADELDREFVASTDNWFRPVHFANGPDGCLYIADMYRETIEHPWSLPEPIKQHLDLNSGNDRGRIYRIAKDGFQSPGRINLGAEPNTALIALLGHANGWHRSAAARLLYQRADASLAAAVKGRWAGLSPLGKVHALHLLAALGRLEKGLVASSLSAADARVRMHGLRLIDQMKLADDLVQTLVSLAGDESLQVRYHLALALGRVDFPEKAAVVRRLLARDGGIEWVRWAALNAVRSGHGGLYASLVTRQPATLAPLARMAGASGLKAEILAVLNAAHDNWGEAEVVASLEALNDGLRARRKGIEDYLGDSRLAGRFQALKKQLGDSTAGNQERVEAVGAIKVMGFRFCADVMSPLLKVGAPDEIRQAVVTALLDMPDSAAFAVVLDNWSQLSDAVRRGVIRRVVGNRSRARLLLTAATKGIVAKSLFDTAQVETLRSSRDKTVAALAVKVFGEAKQLVVGDLMKRYQAALTMKGDAQAGHELFTQRCATCHRANGEGHALGPDLVTVKTKGRENLLLNILNPNAEVAPQYMAFEVDTHDDESFTAVLGDESPTHVTLKMAGGLSRTLARKAVKGMRSNGRSLMPEGLQEGMSANQMADLLRFIETAN